MPITSLYTALLAAWMLFLAIRVIHGRRSKRISLGTAKDPLFERRVRAHGNLIEYAPICLLCLLLLEMNGMAAAVLHGLGIMLIGGRLLHGWALSFTQKNAFGRTAGALLTFIMLGLSICILLWQVVFS